PIRKYAESEPVLGWKRRASQKLGHVQILTLRSIGFIAEYLMPSFRVGLAGGFTHPNGAPTHTDFDLSALERDRNLELIRLNPAATIEATDTADLDALIILGETFGRNSIHSGNRLSVVARFGVGFDKI